MKRHIKFISISAMMSLAALSSCVQMEELDVETVVPSAGEKIRVVLNAGRGASVKSPDTRVQIGSTSGNTVTYWWNDDDQIGVIPLNITDSKPNYVTTEKEIQSDRNYATFNAYITSDGYHSSAAPHLLIYYPYNASMLEGNSGSTGSAFASDGLTFRLPAIQDQYGYNAAPGAADHPSVWALSNYGLAYDLAACYTTADGNDVTSTGNFTLDHANTYFQFNVYGTQSEGSDNNYGDGTWRLSSVTVEAGHCELGTDEEGNTVYTLSDQVSLAGTYKITYGYSESDFNDVAVNNGNDKISLASVAGANSVKVTMNGAADADGAVLGSTADEGAPAFAVINGLGIKENPYGNLNCLKVSVTAYKYSGANIVGSDTRVRYYNIESIAGRDISGNYYTIDFEVCDPVESYTDLSLGGTGNCYIVSAPGNYTFNLDVAGNGKVPYGGFTGPVSDPKNLMDENTDYGFDWLWASGTSFDNADNGSMTDAEIVQKIVNSVELSGEDGRVSIGLATGSTEDLSGNVVFALYEKNSDGSVGKIVWTWHMWLGQPEVQHFKFSSTNTNYNFTNEDWYMFDRNLGAESNELGNPRSVGLYYQSTRKEPLIGFDSASGSTTWKYNQLKNYRNTPVFKSLADWESGVAYSDYNTFSLPMSLITGIPRDSDTYLYAWTTSSGAEEEFDTSNDVKSMFDPCPVGYRMPTTREWDHFKNYEYSGVSGIQGSGMLGSCHWIGVYDELDTDTEIGAAIAESMSGGTDDGTGDYYSVNGQYERTYHILSKSGTGNQIVTVFPNTGVLHADGFWHYTYQGSWTATTPEETVTHIAGPELTTSVSGSTLTVNFTNSGTYFYSTSSTGTKTAISTGGTIDLSSSSLTYNSSGSATLYFYSIENDVYSAATTVDVTRTGRRNYTYTSGTPSPGAAYTETIGGGEVSYEGEATMVLWSSGRTNQSNYWTFWFGPENGRGDLWGSTAPYSDTRESYPFAYGPYAVGGYDNYQNTKQACPAAPIRCIREYDNASVAAISE